MLELNLLWKETKERRSWTAYVEIDFFGITSIWLVWNQTTRDENPLLDSRKKKFNYLIPDIDFVNKLWVIRVKKELPEFKMAKRLTKYYTNVYVRILAEDLPGGNRNHRISNEMSS